MKKSNKLPQNYLSFVPQKAVAWKSDDSDMVTLEKENKGIANRIAQKLLKKPKVSYIHLDEFGSFVWLAINGESDIEAIGNVVDAHFGEKAAPLYERLAKYFQVLESYGFIKMKQE